MERPTPLRRIALVALVAFGSAGCQNSDLDNIDHVRTWANTGSPVAVYQYAYEPIAFADGQATFADPACPMTTDDGTTVTITGGCTNSAGKDFVGTATIVRSGGDRMLTLDGYGSYDDPDMAAATTGTVELRQTSPTTYEFSADYVHEGGIRTTVLYEGSVEGGYDIATTWNGTGTVEREGFLGPTGTVVVRTTDELLDGTVCNGQALSGQTTINSDGETALVEYDGATDCDDAESARWSYEGEDRGLVDGIVCAAAGPGLHIDGGPKIAWIALFLVAVLLVVRRLWPSRSVSRPRPSRP